MGNAFEMAGPRPSSAFLDARRILRAEAIARTERTLRVAPDVMPAIAALAGEQLLPALGEIDPRHGGWSTFASGTLIARNCERLTTAGGDVTADHSYTAGVAWSALLACVVGDRLLDAEDPLRARPWEPSEQALEARRLARELAGEAQDPRSLAATRFAAYALSQLDEGLPQLESRQAGYTMVTLAVWIAGNEARIAEPLGRRRLLRSAIDVEEACGGCALAATVLAEIGESLITRGGTNPP
jgi:hypothetical protein